MSDSILENTKNILGLQDNYTVFDFAIITHINASFSVLSDIGVGPKQGFTIEDSNSTWDLFTSDLSQLSIVKPYVYLKVKMLFDPPATSFHIQAIENQLEEFLYRLSYNRELNTASSSSKSACDEVYYD